MYGLHWSPQGFAAALRHNPYASTADPHHCSAIRVGIGNHERAQDSLKMARSQALPGDCPHGPLAMAKLGLELGDSFESCSFSLERRRHQRLAESV